MAPQIIPYITPEEYLKAERQAEFKSEYYDGQVFPMTGGTLRHHRMAANVTVRLAVALDGGSCQVFNSDMRVHILQRACTPIPMHRLSAAPPRSI